MSKEQLAAVKARLGATPFDRTQGAEQHRKSFDSFAVRPIPADVTAKETLLGGVNAIDVARFTRRYLS